MNGTWDDMSDYVVHFTKADGDSSEYDVLMKILGGGCIRAMNPFGIARAWAPDLTSQRAVCFSEVPLHEVGRIAIRRNSKYGIGFTKDFLRNREGGPVWAVENQSSAALALHSLTESAIPNVEDPIWKLTPFIDFVGKFRNGKVYRFDWEREWRLTGDLLFETTDPAFLFIPEDLHERAREFFVNAARRHTGPSYPCPFLDPTWDKEMIRAALCPPSHP